MDIYYGKHCSKCNLPAVGAARDDYGFRYYCQQHFNAYSYATDKAQDERERQQWGDQAWYQELMGSPAPQQISLL